MIKGMVHTNQQIQIVVKSIKQETPHYLTLIFERPRGFMYQAGDWIDLEFEGGELRGGKTYSLSSSPTEADMTITFKEGLSPLKKALATVSAGDVLTIVQYGNDYGFQLNETKASTLIAGGVGIAPFRSMIKEMVDRGYKNNVELIYLNQTDTFLFQEELMQWKKQVPSLTVHYIVTKDLKRKQREKTIRTLITDTNRRYYIAGPPGMVMTTMAFITDIGVQERNVKIDSFGGY
jgi:ferredoxin-NADP reductase